MGLLNLKGSFEVQIYGLDGKEKSGLTQPNFITSTGLSYPYSVLIGDCFKMLTVGSGTGINTLLTTGMSARYSSLSNLDNYVTDACGYQETTSGVNFFRAWRVPEAGAVSDPSGLVIKELGVHPVALSNSSLSGQLFSRILLDTTVPSGDYSVITYRLNAGLPTGRKSFKGIINSSLVNAIDSPVCRYWNTISGRYSVVHHGLQTIDVDGLALMPAFKDPLEPSNTNTSSLKAYLSTDNYQFVVNGWSGGAIDVGAFRPYTANGKPFGTGLCQYHQTIDSILETRLTDIRKDSILVPDPTNFREEVAATAYTKVSSITTITPESFVATGRTRSLVRLFSWPNAQNLFEDATGLPRPIKSMVVSYDNGGTHYPYCDVIFSPSGAAPLNYSVNSGAYTYNQNSITGAYAFIDPYDNLSLSFRLSWSSDCPDTVSGCPDFIP